MRPLYQVRQVYTFEFNITQNALKFIAHILFIGHIEFIRSDNSVTDKIQLQRVEYNFLLL